MSNLVCCVRGTERVMVLARAMFVMLSPCTASVKVCRVMTSCHAVIDNVDDHALPEQSVL